MTGTDQQSQQYDMKVQEMNSMISGTLNKILQELQNAKPKTSNDSANANKERAEKEAHKKTFNGIKDDAKEIKVLSKTYLKGTFDLLSHKTIGLGAISSNVDIIKKGSIKAFGEIKGALSEITNYSTRIEAKSIVIDNKINDIAGVISSQSNLMTDVSKRIDDNANDAGEAIDYIADQLKKVEDQTSPERSTEEIKKAVDERIDKLSKGLESKSREAQDDQEIQDQRRRFTFKESMDNVKDDIKDRFLSLKDSMSENFSKLFTKPKDTVKKAGGIIAKLLKMAGTAVLGYMLVKKIVSWIQENPEEVEKFKEVFTKVIIPKVKELWGEHITPIWDFIWKGDGNTKSGEGGLSQYFTWDSIKTAASFVWEGAKKNVDIAKYGVLGALLFLGKGGLAAKLTLSYLFGDFMVGKADDLLEAIGFGPDTIKNKLLGKDGKMGLWGTIGVTTLGVGTFIFGKAMATKISTQGLMKAMEYSGKAGSFLFGKAVDSAGWFLKAVTGVGGMEGLKQMLFGSLFKLGAGKGLLGLLAGGTAVVTSAAIAAFLGFNIGREIRKWFDEADDRKKAREEARLMNDLGDYSLRVKADTEQETLGRSLAYDLRSLVDSGDIKKAKRVLSARALEIKDEDERKKVLTSGSSFINIEKARLIGKKKRLMSAQDAGTLFFDSARKKELAAEVETLKKEAPIEVTEKQGIDDYIKYQLEKTIFNNDLFDQFNKGAIGSVFEPKFKKSTTGERDQRTLEISNKTDKFRAYLDKLGPPELLYLRDTIPQRFEQSGMFKTFVESQMKGKEVTGVRFRKVGQKGEESWKYMEDLNDMEKLKGQFLTMVNEHVSSRVLKKERDFTKEEKIEAYQKFLRKYPNSGAAQLPEYLLPKKDAELTPGGSETLEEDPKKSAYEGARITVHDGEAVLSRVGTPESKKWVKLFVNEVKDMLNGKDDGVGAMKDVDDKMDRTMELSQANLQITSQGLGGVVSAIKNSHDSISRKVASITEESYNLKDVRHG